MGSIASTAELLVYTVRMGAVVIGTGGAFLAGLLGTIFYVALSL